MTADKDPGGRNAGAADGTHHGAHDGTPDSISGVRVGGEAVMVGHGVVSC